MMNPESLILLADAEAAAAPQTTIQVPAAEGAPEAAPQQSSGGGLMGMLPFIIIFVVMIFFMTRSQKKQQQKRAAMLNQLTKGARVVTGAGMYGTIVEVKDNSFIIQIADNVKAEFAKNGVTGVVDDSGNPAALDPKKLDVTK